MGAVFFWWHRGSIPSLSISLSPLYRLLNFYFFVQKSWPIIIISTQSKHNCRIFHLFCVFRILYYYILQQHIPSLINQGKRREQNRGIPHQTFYTLERFWIIIFYYSPASRKCTRKKTHSYQRYWHPNLLFFLHFRRRQFIHLLPFLNRVQTLPSFLSLMLHTHYPENHRNVESKILDFSHLFRKLSIQTPHAKRCAKTNKSGSDPPKGMRSESKGRGWCESPRKCKCFELKVVAGTWRLHICQKPDELGELFCF
jgi:hypothetical protein